MTLTHHPMCGAGAGGGGETGQHSTAADKPCAPLIVACLVGWIELQLLRAEAAEEAAARALAAAKEEVPDGE